MTTKLSVDIADLLSEAVKDKIENYEVEIHEGNQKGEGFLSEITFVSLKNKQTGEDHHLIVKQVLTGSSDATLDVMSSSFFNEIQMYSKIFPAYEELRLSYPNAKVFTHIPKCYATDNTDRKEKIVLENLKYKNFELHKKTIPVNLKMYKELFKIYGKLHGVSFALKHHQPENFFELATPLRNIWIKMFDAHIMDGAVEKAVTKVCELLEKNGETQILEKMKKYVTEATEIFLHIQKSHGDKAIIIHGDCWSNNMLFRYNKNGDLEDIKLLDFQLSNLQSPVQDLSYSFYSGADKESLDNLEILQKIYHKSLDETLKQFDCDVNQLYPFETLKKEWMEVSKFGFIMGLIVWQSKTLKNISEVPALNDVIDKKDTLDSKKIMQSFIFDEDKLEPVYLNLVKHMYDNGLL